MTDSHLKKTSNLEDSNNSLPSNEEIVDSLINDIKCVNVDDNKDLETNNVSDTVFHNDSPELNQENEENKTSSGTTNDETETGDNADDFIDEVHLKDLEVGYTDEDRKRLKGEAEVLKNQGNDEFKAGDFRDAAFTYTKALRICPLAFSKDRAVLYSNRGAAKIKLHFSESAIEDCTKAVELDPGYLKAYLRRAHLYEQTDKLDEAFADYKKILEIDPTHKEAYLACQRLPDQINEKNEKLKTEMLGKLKDLGNMILKPFGLSTNNFQMVQDPNTGGYSVNFNQNPTNHR